MRNRERVGHDGEVAEQSAQGSPAPARGGLQGALLDLQQRAGNAATSALVVQAKLTVGHANDPLEHEADRVADAALGALRGGGPVADADDLGGGPAPVRRQGPSGADPLGGLPVDGEVEAGIQSARGGGRPVSRDVADAVGQASGADLSGVRVHTDSHADGLSRSLQARAFTTGSDIFFQSGAYDPSSSSGRETLAHELAHVAQQGGGARRRMVNRRLDP